MNTLIVGLALFFGTHLLSIVAPAWRDRLAARLGEWTWKGLYSLVAIVGFILMIRGYGMARLEPITLYAPPSELRTLAALLMVPVFPLLLAAYLPGRIQRTLKHPLLAATKLWALAHLLVNGGLHDVLLFGSFLIWAAADRVSFKYRTQRPIATAPPSKINDLLAVILGLGLYVAFVKWLHLRWFGVLPLS